MWKGVNVSAEARGGFATFLTMSYIVFVQPAVLSQAGMDFGSVMMATIISSVVATLIMGIFANYPIALAPGMGENFFFAFTIVPTVSKKSINRKTNTTVTISGRKTPAISILRNVGETDGGSENIP